MFLVFAATLPFAQVELTPFPGIILVQNALAFLNDAITASLLFGQYSVSRSRPLSILAFGYLFTALMAVSHALSYPGVFSASGLFDGPAWLYLVGHAVLPLSIIAFAARRPDAYPLVVPRSALVPIVVTAVGAGCLALACTGLIAAAYDWLPPLVQDGRLLPASRVVVAVLLLMPLGALSALAVRKNASVLDIWLMVLMFSWLCTIVLVSIASAQRYDLGWYVGRIFEVLLSLFVLVVLISETIQLYADKFRAAELERRDRERRLNEMEAILAHLSRITDLGQRASTLIHEVSQPLVAISVFAQASLRLADGAPDPLKRSLDGLVEAVANVKELVQSLSRFIKNSDPDRRVHKIAEMIDEAAALAFFGHRPALTVDTRYHSPAPTALCDRVQIKQVIFNILRNAIEAMADNSKQCILTIATAPTADGLIKISIADNGAGLPSTVREKLFEPFVTTKPSGLGIGLSICRVIVEAHGGELRAENNPGGGTIFSFTLPPGPDRERRDVLETVTEGVGPRDPPIGRRLLEGEIG